MELIVTNIIANYHGVVEVYKEDDKYYLTIGNYDTDYAVEISEETAMVLKEEFKEEKEQFAVML